MKIGEYYLVTLKDKFIAPDGLFYNAAFGILNQIVTDKGRNADYEEYYLLGRMVIPKRTMLCAVNTELGKNVKEIYLADY